LKSIEKQRWAPKWTLNTNTIDAEQTSRGVKL
jgi:hypothetical protein